MAWLKTGGFVQVASLVRSPEDWFEAFEPFHPHALTTKTASRLIEGYSPDDYLFSHNTIIASVDVDAEQDWLITPETHHLINDNTDAWERGVIANDWRSFIGAENYQEHVQIPDLSKGKIVDAALRDVGVSLYVDILVATARKHIKLIGRIQSGDLNAMSMGCICDYTICTKCGNRAVDEVQLCNCIKYGGKGNVFIGPDGHQRKIAELCGHRDDPGSVGFIEASWVANPAFRGAVTRNLLTLPELAQKVSTTQFFMPAPRVPIEGGLPKAAHQVQAQEPVMDEAEGFYTGDDTLPPEAQPKKPQRFTEDIFDYLYYDDKPHNTLEHEYSEDESRPFDVESEWGEHQKQNPMEFLEETIVHSSRHDNQTTEFLAKYRNSGLSEEQLLRVKEGIRHYREGGFREAAKAGFRGVELLSLRYFMERFRPHRTASRPSPVSHFNLVRKLNGLHLFASEIDFLKVCVAKMGRKFESRREADRLLQLARLFDLGEGVST